MPLNLDPALAASLTITVQECEWISTEADTSKSAPLMSLPFPMVTSAAPTSVALTPSNKRRALELNPHAPHEKRSRLS
jgi:hypothetical protein